MFIAILLTVLSFAGLLFGAIIMAAGTVAISEVCTTLLGIVFGLLLWNGAVLIAWSTLLYYAVVAWVGVYRLA
jgi:hypothetical protein